MTIRRDENMAPDRAKSCIVILDNLECRFWEKNKKYSPVLQYSSLCLLTSMATKNCHALRQGDCKNSFCNAHLMDDETTIIRPLLGDPDAEKDVFLLLKRIFTV